MPCPSSALTSGIPQSRFCYLPDFDFDPSIAYDVVIYNDAGNVTLSGLIRYAQSPTLIGIDSCVDRGEWFTETAGVQCPSGTTITLRGARFPMADSVEVQFVPYYTASPVSVTLLAATLLNSTTITATLPTLDNVTAADVYGAYGNVQAVFTSANDTMATNILNNRLYIPPHAPNITSVTSTMCDSLSPLQLTNCRAMAAITVVGSNLYSSIDQQAGLLLATSIAAAFQGYNYLLPSNASIQFGSDTSTSLVFTLSYFDADTNVALQPNVVYTLLINSNDGYLWVQSNAFRLSLTYEAAAATATTASSSTLSSGAIAGIVISVVVVVLLVLWTVAGHVRRPRPAAASLVWSSKLAGEGLHHDLHSGGDEYKDVELH